MEKEPLVTPGKEDAVVMFGLAAVGLIVLLVVRAMLPLSG